MHACWFHSLLIYHKTLHPSFTPGGGRGRTNNFVPAKYRLTVHSPQRVRTESSLGTSLLPQQARATPCGPAGAAVVGRWWLTCQPATSNNEVLLMDCSLCSAGRGILRRPAPITAGTAIRGTALKVDRVKRGRKFYNTKWKSDLSQPSQYLAIHTRCI